MYIPAGGLSEKPYATLFGRPVIPLEQCNAAGEVGDIILADIGQYLMIDKGGVKAASSIHVRFCTMKTFSALFIVAMVNLFGINRLLLTKVAQRSRRL